MDPLVRAAVGIQKTLARLLGTGVVVCGGLYLCWSASEQPPLIWDVLVGLAILGSLGLRIWRRLVRLTPSTQTLLDIEVFSHMVLVAYALVLHLPGALDGPAYPVVYALMMLTAAYARPAATFITVFLTVSLEAGLQVFALGREPLAALPHVSLIVVFAVLNLVVFRAELARVRRLSKQRIASEIERMKQAARSYRLIGAPSSAVERGSLPPPGNEDRLLQSGVDEIHQAVSFALDLLRSSLDLRTATLLLLDNSGKRLHIQELSTDDDTIVPGPFSAKDGVMAAALVGRRIVCLTKDKAINNVPYYGFLPVVGSVCAVPLLEGGQPRGLLMADRPSPEPFDEREQRMLMEASHFILRAMENERVFVQLEKAKSEQGKLYRSVDTLAAASTEAEVIEACVSSAREFAAFDFAVVTLFDRHAAEHEICAVSGEGAEELVGQRFRHNGGLVSMVVANRHPLPYRGDYDAKRQVVFTKRLAPPAMPSLLVLPLVVHDRALGTLVLGSHRRGALGDSVRPTLEVLASHVAVSLANARMLKRLEEMATTDGMTGLLNKRALTEMAAQKLRSSKRFDKPLSVLVCDIDHFKRVNDTYGHDIGDVVIKGFGEVLKRTKRDTDVVGRFGGEEFVVVCEETDAGGAALLAERIRIELEAKTFHTEQGTIQVTCSVGVATFPRAGEEWDALFKATDEALYASKRGGRNRVTVWSPRLAGAAA